MKFKVVGKSLILTDCSHKITKGENSFDTVEIVIPNSHDDCDLSTLCFRFSEISEDGESSAVQILRHAKCDEKYIYLKGMITSDFSAITGKVIFMLIGVSGENVVAKFQSTPYMISDDISLASLPNVTAAEQLFNQAQLEVQKAMEAAERAEIFSKTPAPAEIYPATQENLGGIKSGGDISVSANGTVTVNSVNGKTLGKSVPADAAFTDTVYTLPKATTETLGGVKVDGKTITAGDDGTISAKEVQNLALQIAHPNNFLIYDDLDKPSVMVAIPKFYLDEVIDGASHTVHPAFIINGVEQDVIYISKYQNIIENERAYSLPMKNPQTNITFDQAWQYCKNKGTNWHLMTNAEWAAIALWCKKNGTIPKGNNNYGKDFYEINLPQKAIPAEYDGSGQITKILTGSGPESWYHDGTFAGIADVNGNLIEFVSGLRLCDGEIQIVRNNDSAINNSMWKAITTDGTLVEPGTLETIHYSSSIYNTKFSDISVEPPAVGAGKILLEALCLLPHKDETFDYGDDRAWTGKSGVYIAIRGGSYMNKSVSGLFTLNLSNVMSYKFSGLGFRCAYCGKACS